MANSDLWKREYIDASKLADEINGMISATPSLPDSSPEKKRHTSATRRKTAILRTKLVTLESFLSKHPISGKDMNRRQEMLKKLSSKVNQMATTLNMSTSADRESLLGLDKKPDAMSRAVGLDSHGLVGLQRQIMKEQDVDLDKLEETVTSTKHIALAVNEELTLHARLLDDLDQHVDSTNSRLQRVQKRVAILNKGTKGGCCCLILLVIVIVILIVVIWAIINYF